VIRSAFRERAAWYRRVPGCPRALLVMMEIPARKEISARETGTVKARATPVMTLIPVRQISVMRRVDAPMSPIQRWRECCVLKLRAIVVQ